MHRPNDIHSEESEALVNKLQRKLDRIALTNTDMEEADGFCDAYLEALGETGLLHGPSKALTIAIAVSYCRPFSGNLDRDGKKEANRHDDLIAEAADSFDLDMHEEVLEDRDTFIAHSDAEVAPTLLSTLGTGNLVFVRKYPHVAYTAEKVARIRANIARLRSLLQPKEAELQAALKNFPRAFKPFGG